jgi:hypothetical protein
MVMGIIITFVIAIVYTVYHDDNESNRNRNRCINVGELRQSGATVRKRCDASWALHFREQARANGTRRTELADRAKRAPPEHNRQTMKTIAFIVTIISTLAFSSVSEAATCTGSNLCTACKNCRYCKHCAKEGGACGVCKR